MKDLERRMAEEPYWADKIAEKLIGRSKPGKKIVCAAGISPSGVVHIGNFRDVLTSDLVCRSLREKGYDAELIFSWDDYDRLRKVPKGIPDSFAQHMGKPLAEIPDPEDCHDSYAKHFQVPFEQVMPELGVPIRFIHQAREYGKNRYYSGIKLALQKRKEIAEILASFMTQGMTPAEIEAYYPLQVYCGKCRRSTETEIKKYDGENGVTYKCNACNHKETVDISKRNIGKLDWKVDWPMRWAAEGVVFEPGGEDHATPGGSYDVSSVIAKRIFGIEPPIFQGYGFVGIEGASKMSSSKGSGVSPKDLLQVYEPELLRWLFTRARPDKPITLFFDTEIIRQYDEFDKAVSAYLSGKLPNPEKRALDFAKVDTRREFSTLRTPFRQVASFGQIAQGNLDELEAMYDRMNQPYNALELRQRLVKSQNWVRNFAPDMAINVLTEPNKEYWATLDKKHQTHVERLRDELDKHWGLSSLTTFAYAIPKTPGMADDAKRKAQREFFGHVYQLLIRNDTGPRLPTFLLALGKERVKSLLDFKHYN